MRVQYPHTATDTAHPLASGKYPVRSTRGVVKRGKEGKKNLPQ